MLLKTIFATTIEIVISLVLAAFITAANNPDEIPCNCDGIDETPIVQPAPSPTPDCGAGVVTGDGLPHPCM